MAGAAVRPVGGWWPRACRVGRHPARAAHFLVDFEDAGDRITLHCSHNCAADPSEFLRSGDTRGDTGAAVPSDLHGMLSAPTDLGALGRHVIDADSATLVDSEVLFDETHTWGGPQLYTHAGFEPPGMHEHLWWICTGFAPETRVQRVEDLYSDYKYRRVALSDLPSEDVPASLFRLDAQGLEIRDAYSFPAGRFCLSPQHIPRQGATDDLDGYIAIVVISDDTSTDGSTGDELWIFDAANLAQGPLARLAHPDLSLPFTLHTAWMPAVTPAHRQLPHRCTGRSRRSGGKLNEDLQAMFERDVYPNFEGWPRDLGGALAVGRRALASTTSLPSTGVCLACGSPADGANVVDQTGGRLLEQ